jgi:primosomal protein N'
MTEPTKNDFIGMRVAVNAKDGEQRIGVVYGFEGSTLLVSCGGETVHVPRKSWVKWQFYKVRMVLP